MPATTVREARSLGPSSSRRKRTFSTGKPSVRETRTVAPRNLEGHRDATGPQPKPLPAVQLHAPRTGEEDRTLRRIHPGPRHLKKSPRMLARGARRRAHAQSWLQARDSSRRVFLKSHAVRAPTKAGYRQMLAKMAVRLFYWNVTLTMDIPLMIPEFKTALDEAMSDYCDFLYFEGEPGSFGSQLYSSLSDHWPEVGKSGSCPLPRLFRARQTWRRLAPGRT